jgi:hypothetical protein
MTTRSYRANVATGGKLDWPRKQVAVRGNVMSLDAWSAGTAAAVEAFGSC